MTQLAFATLTQPAPAPAYARILVDPATSRTRWYTRCGCLIATVPARPEAWWAPDWEAQVRAHARATGHDLRYYVS